MAFTSLVVGRCPGNEKPVETGAERYLSRQHEQCWQFIRLIERHIGKPPDVAVGPPAAGAFIRIRTAYDENYYKFCQVVLFYEATDPDAADYAERLDTETPLNWDKPYGELLKERE